MKYSELSIGEWFKTSNDVDEKIRYMKIDPIVDVWGNTFVAVNNYGFMLDSENIPFDMECIFLDTER